MGLLSANQCITCCIMQQINTSFIQETQVFASFPKSTFFCVKKHSSGTSFVRLDLHIAGALFCFPMAQPTFSCSMSTIETLEKRVKYVQS